MRESDAGDSGARAAALSILNARACGALLRACGEAEHAANWEAAIQRLSAIIAEHVGHQDLTNALDWASDQSWGCGLGSPSLARN